MLKNLDLIKIKKPSTRIACYYSAKVTSLN